MVNPNRDSIFQLFCRAYKKEKKNTIHWLELSPKENRKRKPDIEKKIWVNKKKRTRKNKQSQIRKSYKKRLKK